jgi:putative peptidoglycan lipid II flippase
MTDAALPEHTTDAPKSPPSLLKAAGFIALITLVSKVLGAVRDWLIMWAFGASLASDAYFAAVQIPAFGVVLLGGLGGPFHTATVAVFSKLLAGKPKADQTARLLASTFLTATGVVFLALSVAAFIWAEPLMHVMLPDGSPQLIHQAAVQLKIMAPSFWLGGTIGILYGLANVFHHFFWPSLSPAAMNVVMIAALLLLPHDPSGNILAWSTLVGTLAQVLLQLPDILKDGFSLKPAWRLKMPELKNLTNLLFPAMLGTTIGQLTTYVDIFFTSTLALGSWTAIVMANRLIQLPIGVLQTALVGAGVSSPGRPSGRAGLGRIAEPVSAGGGVVVVC